MARTLCLDVGDRRIGVAVCDATGIVATPLTTVTRRGIERDVAAITGLAQEQEAGGIVVGMPLTLRGEVGPQAQRVQAFCDALRAGCPLPLATWSEQYTTAEAERRMRAAGASPSRDRARVDALAAAIILQEWLDAGGRLEAP